MSNETVVLLVYIFLSGYATFGNFKKFKLLDIGRRNGYEQTCLTSETIVFFALSMGSLIGSIILLFKGVSIHGLIVLGYFVVLADVGLLIPRCTHHEFIGSNPSKRQRFVYYGSNCLLLIMLIGGYLYFSGMF